MAFLTKLAIKPVIERILSFLAEDIGQNWRLRIIHKSSPLPLYGPDEADTIHIGHHEGRRRTKEAIITETPSPSFYDETLENIHIE